MSLTESQKRTLTILAPSFCVSLPTAIPGSIEPADAPVSAGRPPRCPARSLCLLAPLFVSGLMAPPAERFARVGKQMATTTAHLPALAAARKLYQLTEEEKSRMWVRAADGKLKIKRSMSFSKFEEHSWSMPVGASLFRSFLRTQL